MFYYSKISNHTYDRRSRHSTQAKAKVILLLYRHCIPSGPAVKPQDQRAIYIILSSSMFHSLTSLLALLSRTQSTHS